MAENTRVWFHFGPAKKMLYNSNKEERELTDREKKIRERKEKKAEKKRLEREKYSEEDGEKRSTIKFFVGFLKEKENRDYIKTVAHLVIGLIKKIFQVY